MNALWLKLAARYDALQLRERWLVAGAVLGGILLIGFSLVLEPALKRAQLAERSMAEQHNQFAAIQSQLAMLQTPERNPDVAARAELDGLKKQLSQLAGRMEAMESALVPPQRMSGLLEEMIGRKSSLRLLSLKTLPVTPLLDKKPATEEKEAIKEMAKAVDKRANSSSGLFKHGVEIKLEGSYQELAAYLERLEQSKLKLLWSSVALSADKHPRLELTLTVYTLSLDRAWLIV